MVVWQHRTGRWSRHTDNVAGSSDAKPKKEATRKTDNSIRHVQLKSVLFQPTTSALNHKQSVNVGEVSTHGYLPHRTFKLSIWAIALLRVQFWSIFGNWNSSTWEHVITKSLLNQNCVCSAQDRSRLVSGHSLTVQLETGAASERGSHGGKLFITKMYTQVNMKCNWMPNNHLN
jgi:hypothetical protein